MSIVNDRPKRAKPVRARGLVAVLTLWAVTLMAMPDELRAQVPLVYFYVMGAFCVVSVVAIVGYALYGIVQRR